MRKNGSSSGPTQAFLLVKRCTRDNSFKFKTIIDFLQVFVISCGKQAAIFAKTIYLYIY